MIPRRATLSASSLRRFILVTLSQADKPQRRHITQDEIRIRFELLFRCTAIVIAREKHKDMTNHFHVSVLNENASRHTAARLIRNTFPEWEGRQCWVTFHKAWSTLCAYVTKHDKRPYVWGKFSLQQILQVASAGCKHKKVGRTTWEETLFQKLSKYDDWMELKDDPDFRGALWSRYSTVRRLWKAVQLEKQQSSATTESIVAYLWDKGWPTEYTAEELKEKYLLLDWVATNLVYQRPIMTRQLFVYGPPNTQKTQVISILAKVLKIYFVGERRNDYSGANDYFDLWVIDGFMNHTEEALNRMNGLLKVLDGQKCRLDAKYEKPFVKNANVPVVIMANEMPSRSKRNEGRWAKRIMPLYFHSGIKLEEERLIATFWGCLFRKACINPQELMDNPCLEYNSLSATEVLVNDPGTTRGKILALLKIRRGEGILVVPIRKDKGETIPYLDLEYSQVRNGPIDLLQFAIVPLREGGTNDPTQTTLTNMVIRREVGEDPLHYAVWPLFVKKTKTNTGYPLRVKVHYDKTGEDEEGDRHALYQQLEEQMNEEGNERQEQEVEILVGLPSEHGY